MNLLVPNFALAQPRFRAASLHRDWALAKFEPIGQKSESRRFLSSTGSKMFKYRKIAPCFSLLPRSAPHAWETKSWPVPAALVSWASWSIATWSVFHSFSLEPRGLPSSRISTMFYMFMIQLLGESQVRPEGGGELRQCHARYNLVQLLDQRKSSRVLYKLLGDA